MHAPIVLGGTGWSTYAEQCLVRLERRTLPHETAAMVAEEIQALLDALHAQDARFNATCTLGGAQPRGKEEARHAPAACGCGRSRGRG